MSAIGRRVGAVLAIVLILGSSARSYAAWPHDPNNGNVALCTATGSQQGPTIVSDGAGGAIVTWTDFRSGTSDIYVQRVNAAGVPLWTADGVALCTAANAQLTSTIASDGAGGAIVTWYDLRNGATYDIYAQRVNAVGVPQWIANGVALCAAANSQFVPTIVSDGAGGAIVTWHDGRNGASYDIFVQRVNAAGVPQWTANGVALSTAANIQSNPTIVSDGAAGAIVTWQDSRGGNYDIYAQRVNAAGVPLWTANGLALVISQGDQLNPTIVSDGANGAIVTWFDYRSGVADIYAQRVNAAGAPLWAPGGAALSTAPSDQVFPTIVSDGAGGAIVTWHDFRNGPNNDIYAQRVSAAGVPSWTLNGVALSTANNNQEYPMIVSDGAGGAIVTWHDYRNDIAADIYAQRVSAAGVPLWTANGVTISTANSHQYYPTIVSDGTGGAIVTWQDLRNGVAYDIYVQRIERFGYLGNPEPSIVNVKDYPNDQGGKVRIKWDASYLDSDPYNTIGNYNVWRQAPPFVAQTALKNGAHLLGDGERPEGATGPVFRTTPGTSGVYYWEFVASQIAQGFQGYSYVTATGSDSVGAGNPYTRFMVEAKSASSAAYWNSAPDSGYSVDNLPPSAPAPFTGAYAAGATHLHWDLNGEADLAGYRLYHGTSPGFVPDVTNLLSAQPDTGYADAGAAGSWYKLSAFDAHGNESLFAILGPNGTLSAPGAGSTVLHFAPPAPNPMRAAGTMFRFGLPAGSRVALTIYDPQGRAVRELARGAWPAGEHELRWDGRDAAGQVARPGLYFARLETSGRTFTRRLTLLR